MTDILIEMTHDVAQFVHGFDEVCKLQFADARVHAEARKRVLHERDAISFVLLEGGVVLVVAVFVALQRQQQQQQESRVSTGAR